MSEFSEEIFEKKLSELRDSQKEIQSLSQYCVHNRQNCKIVVKVTILLSSFMMVEMVNGNSYIYFKGLVQRSEEQSSC